MRAVCQACLRGATSLWSRLWQLEKIPSVLTVRHPQKFTNIAHRSVSLKMIVVVPVHLKTLGGTNQRISTHTFVKHIRKTVISNACPKHCRGCLEEMVQDEGGAREPKNSAEYVVEDVNVHTNVIVNERKKGKQEKGKERKNTQRHEGT